MRAPVPFVLVNHTDKVVPDSTCVRILSALASQVGGEFHTAWGVSARLSYCRPNQRVGPDAGAGWLVICTNPAQAAELGYKDKTPSGRALVLVFSDLEGSTDAITEALSRELLNHVVDPGLSLLAQIGDGIHAFSVCDPVAGCGYAKSGIRVSDFVLPAYFEEASKGPFDYMRRLKSAGEIAPNGRNLVARSSAGVSLEGPAVEPGTKPTPGSSLDKRTRRNDLEPSSPRSATHLITPPARVEAPIQRVYVPKPGTPKPIPAPIRSPDRGAIKHEIRAPKPPLRWGPKGGKPVLAPLIGQSPASSTAIATAPAPSPRGASDASPAPASSATSPTTTASSPAASNTPATPPSSAPAASVGAVATAPASPEAASTPPAAGGPPAGGPTPGGPTPK